MIRFIVIIGVVISSFLTQKVVSAEPPIQGIICLYFEDGRVLCHRTGAVPPGLS